MKGSVFFHKPLPSDMSPLVCEISTSPFCGDVAIANRFVIIGKAQIVVGTEIQDLPPDDNLL